MSFKTDMCFQRGTASRQRDNWKQVQPILNNLTSTVKVIQGQPLVVICNADGNPSPQMSWNPEGEDKVNKSRLFYSAISRNEAVVHICTATNNMVPTTGSQQQGFDSKQLLIDVLYSPIVDNFTSPVNAIEGKPLVVICNADGNPSPQMSWNPEGEDKVNKSRLYYSAISRNKAVVHTCTATNNMIPTTGSQQQGSGYKELLINVLYNASVSGFTSKDNISKVNENGSLQLQCEVDSNPYSVISLYLENDLKLKVENALSLNYTKRAACLDAGTYICSARNEIMNGTAVSKSIQINVTCYPRLDNRRNISTEHYGALGDNVTLEVYFIAHPEPSDIAWYHSEKETDMWQPFPYHSPSFNGSYSSITVHLATARDFGNYKVNMSNDFGIYSNTYLIKAESGAPETLGIPVAAIAWGVSAVFVLILVMGLGIFLWRRSQQKKQNENENDVIREHNERFVGHDAANGQEYEGLHLKRGEASPYLQLHDIGLEENRNANTRPPENDSYETLHQYTNNDIQMYSSLKILKTSKDSERMYENTQISCLPPLSLSYRIIN